MPPEVRELRPNAATPATGRKYPLLSLVLPTFNERENLPRLVPRLVERLEAVGCPFELIVVDDDSPDRTWELAAAMAVEDSRVCVVRRQGERGLATAVVAGWKVARGEVLGVMDADLQYPPEGLPALLEPIVEGDADVVVASRYTPGARVGRWSLRREIVSRGAIRLARLALPGALRDLRDPNAGYFLLRRRVIEGVELRPIGFKILIEVLARGHWRRVVELPHLYEGRQEGHSKLGARQSLEFLQHLARLAWETTGPGRRRRADLPGAAPAGR
jgi:dolichol-phosphate mannosyltransferase